MGRARSVEGRGRLGRAVVVVLACAFLSVAGPAGKAALASAPPPDGTLTMVGRAPNYHYQEALASHNSPVQSIMTTALTDPVNHLLFEYDQNDNCIKLFVLDLDTYALKTPAVGSPCTDASKQNIPYDVAAPVMAIDPTDHLLVAPFAPALTSLTYYDESTLKPLGSWSLPLITNPSANPQHYIVGVTWYAAEDAVLVMTDNRGGPGTRFASPAPGVTVTSLSVPLSLKEHKPVVLWSSVIPAPCEFSVTPNYATASAYQSDQGAAVYVPCILQYTPGFEQKSAVGMFKLDTGHNGTGSAVCMSSAAVACPNGAYHVAEAPGPTNDLFFDPASDRGFMPSQTTETDLLVYDGTTGTFGGSVKYGEVSDSNQNAVGLDTESGRLYTMAPSTGLTLIDGRRTPVPAGVRFPQYGIAQQINSFAALPPDAAYGYTRLLVNDDQGFHGTNTGVQPDFLVFADRVPVTTDPAINSIDENTHSGPVVKGSAVQAVYGASASGFAFHHDYVGGVNGQSFDVEGQPLDLPGGGSSDMLGANVSGLSLRNGLPLGSATALADAAGQSGYMLAQCSRLDYDLRSSRACVGRPDCVIYQDLGADCPALANIPTPEPTGHPLPPGQAWPFPEAGCPTADGKPTDTESGATATMPDGSVANLPGSDMGASASADCTLPTVRGDAALQSFGGSSTGYAVGVAGGHTTASVSSATPGAPLTSSVTAVARGIDISTVDATGAQKPLLHINSVTQSATTRAAGVPGSTGATDSVLLEGVYANGSELCAVCDISTVTNQLNTILAARMRVEVPAPDPRYLNSCGGTRLGGTMTCTGSPGGYLATVQANLNEQEGDQRFNQMTEQESTYLPALRIVLYGQSDGQPTRDRQVIDLAGVAVDTEYGISVLPPPSATELGDIAPAAAAIAAGLPTSDYIPGTPGGPTSSTGLLTTIRRVVTRVFEGMRWLARHPLEALQMGAMLSLLMLPLVMARRRGAWFVRRPAL